MTIQSKNQTQNVKTTTEPKKGSRLLKGTKKQQPPGQCRPIYAIG